MRFAVIAMEILFFLVVAYFALYVLLELRILLISRKLGRGQSHAPARPALSVPSVLSASDFFPPVAVLLPICNETSVIDRLVPAVCKLDYPPNLLEILVLDDSTDETSDRAFALVASHAACGCPVRYLKRNSRTGFKAENLRYGVSHAQADFFAVFDADFVPPPDFLLQTIPCFKNDKLGYLQTGIGYINRDASFLTKFQAAEMQHQQFVTAGLRADGNMASLSGSSCVWRRTCLEALGGWNATTATEDVDIGYRAQLDDWEYAYLKDVVSLSVLPETVSAFRIQRERWGRGLLHSAFRHGMRIFRRRMSMTKRLYAISMMFSSLLLVSIYCLFLLTLPLTWAKPFEGTAFGVVCMLFFVLVAVWGAGNVAASQMWEALGKGGSALKKCLGLYGYIAMFLPMSLYYSAGGVRALMGVYEEFNTTPKGKDETSFVKPQIDAVLFYGEVFSFFYSCAALAVAAYTKYYSMLPFNITACVAFAMVLYWGWRDKAARAGKTYAGH